jgi:hypothetical protein
VSVSDRSNPEDIVEGSMQRAACYAQGRANLGDMRGILSALINEPFDFPYHPQRCRYVCNLSRDR